MSNNTFISEKKKYLLATKEKILEEIKYYEKRIEDERNKTKIEYYLDDASSDSDDDFSITTELGPSVMQLKMEQSKLRTCLQATQELTNLQILQSEVNVIVNDPVLNREPPVSEPGTWREVTAECRMDLIPFSITFNMHKANGMFGAKSYRGLQVILVKAAHEAELSQSVLPTLVRPSDALEVLRSYAEAYRSRRSTLARLATKYADSLYMEPMAEGGYLLKCADLLQVAWRLENKWSPLSRFHHRMKFDLEYMEEKYINTITDSHKQLSDPSISTDDRTLLLSKIIATCLEAKPVSESADSDQEARLPKRRATLDQEIDEPDSKKKKEVMAPPKSLPKKAKVTKSATDKSKPSNPDKAKTQGNAEGDKENVDTSNAAKNVVSDKNVGNVEKNVASGSKTVQKQAEKTTKNVTKSKNSVEPPKDKVADKNNADDGQKNKKVKTVSQNKNHEAQSDNVDQVIEKPQVNKKSAVKEKNKKVAKNTEVDINKHSGKEGESKNSKVSDSVPLKKADTNKNSAKDIGQVNNSKANEESNVNKKKIKVVEKNDIAVPDGKSSSKKSKVNDGISKNKENINKAKEDISEPNKAKVSTKPKKDTANVDNNTKNVQPTNEKLISKAIEKIPSTERANKAVEKNIASSSKNKDKILDIAKKTSTKTINSKGTEKLNTEIIESKDPAKVKSIEANKVVAKKTISEKNKTSSNIPKTSIDKDKPSKLKTKTSQENINKEGKNVKSSDIKKSVLPLRMQNNLKMLRKSIGNINAKTSNVKENGSIKSKIPQKRMSPLNEKNMKKNPLRMSPRHIASTFNSTSSSVAKLSIQKSTNIPRLTKPMFRAK